MRRGATLRPPRDEKGSFEKEHITITTKSTPLPRSLEESLSALQEDTTIVQALGEPFIRWSVSFH